MKINSILIILLLLSCSFYQTFGQRKMVIDTKDPKEWAEIPGLHHGSPIALTNEKVFIKVASAAAISYVLAKYILKSKDQGDFWQVRSSYSIGEYKNVFKENFGVEHRVSSWFAIALELSFQQWKDSKPNINKNAKFGMGIGLQPYFRWYALGKKRISPFLEYGTGFFQGFEKFPYNGTKFTFTHSSHIGIEYTSKKGNKMRLGYGQFHQSNNDWWEVNPSHNANGFNLTYSWKIRE